ncbi:MAG: hypothetical protein Q9190_004315 [Brigantiaea leucoxantha]
MAVLCLHAEAYDVKMLQTNHFRRSQEENGILEHRWLAVAHEINADTRSSICMQPTLFSLPLDLDRARFGQTFALSPTRFVDIRDGDPGPSILDIAYAMR